MSSSINTGLVVSIVGCLLTGCSRPGTARNERDAAFAANVKSNQFEFYPDLGYVLVVLGNTDSGTEAIAARVRALLTSAAPSYDCVALSISRRHAPQPQVPLERLRGRGQRAGYRARAERRKKSTPTAFRIYESKLWQYAEASATEAPTAVTAIFIATLNQLIDTDAERVAAARNQIPAGVWLILITVARHQLLDQRVCGRSRRRSLDLYDRAASADDQSHHQADARFHMSRQLAFVEDLTVHRLQFCRRLSRTGCPRRPDRSA